MVTNGPSRDEKELAGAPQRQRGKANSSIRVQLIEERARKIGAVENRERK